MWTAISSSTLSDATAITQAAPVQQIQAPKSASGSIPSPYAISDSVHLSPAAEAHAMQQQGMAVKAIAANMGVTTQVVNSYLGSNSIVTGGGGSGASAAIKNIAAHVRVNPTANGEK